ncbi:MAG TPA: HDIG domain-containing protein [Planctomycetaceae bacterium]|jgi:putative nucleotidyltransferase with HDIG domain|nr:HDIG domain-containing protein [Planctomycetaceae bacterium]
MPVFGFRKKRFSRVLPLKPAGSFLNAIRQPVANRSVWLRLGMCGVALAALVICLRAWQSPFPYRIGDYIDHGIIARVDFKRVDRFNTDRARADAEAQTPHIFRNDPEPLLLLPAKLRANLREIADSKSLKDVSAKTRDAFGLTAEGRGGPANPRGLPPEDEFAILRRVLTAGIGAAGNQIESVIKEFEDFTTILRVRGLADVDQFAAHKIGGDQSLAIVPAKSEVPSEVSPQEVVFPADVQLSELLKESGVLGQSWIKYPRLNACRRLFERWLVKQASVTLTYDGAATLRARHDARDRTLPVMLEYPRNTILVPARTFIDDDRLAVLRTEHEALGARLTPARKALRIATVSGMLLILAAIIGLYLRHNEQRVIASPGRLFVYLTMCVSAVVLGHVLSFDPWRAEIVPITVVVMVLAIVYGNELAILTAVSLALVLTPSTTGSVGELVLLIAVAVIAVAPLGRIASRSRLVKVGFQTAAACFLISAGFELLAGEPITGPWFDQSVFIRGARTAGWCLVAGYLVAGSLPFIEQAFGVVTNISLLEMSDISHPLLRELVRLAPGTYNHSIAVATIGETAAEKIGANGLLVRVGAYYHDIGKMLKPHYFVENMTEGSTSRHLSLAPAMSTLIIIGHVKDGVDLAAQYNLPRPLVDFIEQHHGTTLVEYFYREATRLADRQPDYRPGVEESAFRYPGPKPQTREAGVLMLADAVESASRTLSEPTPKRIENLVHDIAMNRLLDGQFDECSLTLSEIHAIEESLVKSVIGIYHSRIKYPEQRTA